MVYANQVELRSCTLCSNKAAQVCPNATAPCMGSISLALMQEGGAIYCGGEMGLRSTVIVKSSCLLDNTVCAIFRNQMLPLSRQLASVQAKVGWGGAIHAKESNFLLSKSTVGPNSQVALNAICHASVVCLTNCLTFCAAAVDTAFRSPNGVERVSAAQHVKP